MHRFLVRVVFKSIRNLEKFMVDMRNKAGHTVNLRNPTPFPSMWLQEKQIQWNLEDIILISQEKRWVLSGYLYCWQEKRSPTKFESGFSGGSEPPSSPVSFMESPIQLSWRLEKYGVPPQAVVLPKLPAGPNGLPLLSVKEGSLHN